MTSTIRRVTTHTGDTAWLVTGYQSVRSLLCDSRLARSHPDPRSAARISQSAAIDRPRRHVTTEDADHRAVRRLLLNALSASSLARLEPAVRRLVDGLLDDLVRHGRPADFHRVVSVPLPAMVICELLGLPRTDLDQLLDLSARATDTGDRSRAGDGFQRLCRYLGQRVLSRDDPPARLLARLARTYPASVAASVAAELFIAGHQTTTAAIDKGLVLLLAAPPEVRRSACRPETVAIAVEEIVRLPAPVAAPGTARLVLRYARGVLEIAGEQIRPGDLVLLALDEANMDETVFASPTTPDFQRCPNPHLGFGFGPYTCIGVSLARLEMTILFESLSRRMPGLALALPEDRLRPRDNQLMGGITDLPVTW